LKVSVLNFFAFWVWSKNLKFRFEIILDIEYGKGGPFIITVSGFSFKLEN